MLNALDGQARVALARGEGHKAQALVERLLAEARVAAPSTGLFAGAYEHLIRLTLYRVRAGFDPVGADVLLDAAHAALMAEADRIRDVGLRQLFLSCINEHREIVELWTQRQRRLR